MDAVEDAYENEKLITSVNILYSPVNYVIEYLKSLEEAFGGDMILIPDFFRGNIIIRAIIDDKEITYEYYKEEVRALKRLCKTQDLEDRDLEIYQGIINDRLKYIEKFEKENKR